MPGELPDAFAITAEGRLIWAKQYPSGYFYITADRTMTVIGLLVAEDPPRVYKMADATLAAGDSLSMRVTPPW